MIPGMGGGTNVSTNLQGGQSQADGFFNPNFGAVNVGTMDWKKTAIIAAAAVAVAFVFLSLKKR